MEGRKRTCCGAPAAERRGVLKAALGLGLSLPFVRVAGAQQTDPKSARPQPGDRFVFASPDRRGDFIRVEDLPLGGPLALAYPIDPGGEVVRDGSRFNQLLLLRLDPEELTEDTRAHAAEGVVAYSAICTHENCPVSAWKAETRTLLCNCHGSEFDPANAAEVVTGPATRRLPALPLEVEEDGVVVAAGELSGSVGARR